MQLQPKFLVVSALVPYKRVDLAMMAARQAGVRLTVVGNGPSAPTSSAWPATASSWSAGAPTRRFATCIDRRIATILPGEEDFGIVPVEAQACGRPVVALGRGGALDTVIDGETGVLFADTTVESLAAGLHARRDDHVGCRRASARTPRRFSRDAFRQRDRAHRRRHVERTGGTAMVRRHNRLLVAFHVVTDAVLGMVGVLPRLPAALRDRA